MRTFNVPVGHGLDEDGALGLGVVDSELGHLSGLQDIHT